MYTLMIAAVVGLIVATIAWNIAMSAVLSVILALVAAILINVLFGRHYFKKMTALMESAEKDIKAERIDKAVERLKTGYGFAKWQFLVKKQIDTQIGAIYYARKRFDEAFPLLQKTMAKNWPALCMLASYYYKTKDFDNAFKSMDKAISSNKKEPFVYSLYAYMLSEHGKIDKAIEVLNKGTSKVPLDERLSGELDGLRNNKKIKMQAYGPMWMQMHLGAKMPEGAKQYQTFLMNQRIKRR